MSFGGTYGGSCLAASSICDCSTAFPTNGAAGTCSAGTGSTAGTNTCKPSCAAGYTANGTMLSTCTAGTGNATSGTCAATTGTCVATTGTTTVTVVKQSVTFGATFTIPSAGVPITSGSNPTSVDFNTAYYSYGVAVGVYSQAVTVYTQNAGLALAAAPGRRGTAVAMTTSITTCASGTCNAPVAPSTAAASVNTAAAAPGLAASIVASALAAGVTLPAPTGITVPVVQGGDSGKTAVVAVTAFAIAALAMVM